jgi:hypothetical protein
MSVSFAGGSRRPAATENPADSAGSDGGRKDARSAGHVACVSARRPSVPPHGPVAAAAAVGDIFRGNGWFLYMSILNVQASGDDTFVSRELPSRTRVVPLLHISSQLSV